MTITQEQFYRKFPHLLPGWMARKYPHLVLTVDLEQAPKDTVLATVSIDPDHVPVERYESFARHEFESVLRNVLSAYGATFQYVPRDLKNADEYEIFVPSIEHAIAWVESGLDPVTHEARPKRKGSIMAGSDYTTIHCQIYRTTDWQKRMTTKLHSLMQMVMTNIQESKG